MRRLLMLSTCILFCVTSVARVQTDEVFFVRANAKNTQERNKIVEAGLAIDGLLSDSVTLFATKSQLEGLDRAGVSYEISRLPEKFWRGFPTADQAFHDYAETLAILDKLAADYPQIVSRISIGKSLEGRDLAGVRISGNGVIDSLPTAFYVGCHHAREHLSVELPLMLAQYLAKEYGSNPRIKNLIDTREVWIVPMVNPDGAEYDIKTGSYKYWRKNRRQNNLFSYGVDLNRNYGKGFGGPGSSSDTNSDIYHGPNAFSEPETAAVRDFMRDRKKITTALTYHTFSELVLWPWGHTEGKIANQLDRETFEALGNKMATWNKYKPMKSSDLYVASGDMTDWAYDELNVFAFTFELTPSSFLLGGFYPGASAIQPTFNANLEAALYLLEMTENPHAAVLRKSSDPLGMLN